MHPALCMQIRGRAHGLGGAAPHVTNGAAATDSGPCTTQFILSHFHVFFLCVVLDYISSIFCSMLTFSVSFVPLQLVCYVILFIPLSSSPVQYQLVQSQLEPLHFLDVPSSVFCRDSAQKSLCLLTLQMTGKTS